MYVDDMLIAKCDRAEIGKLNWQLHKKFSMKELGEAQHILGMRIERERTKKIPRLSQPKYIQKVLKRFNMDKLKPALTPLSTSIRLSDIESPSTKVDTEQMRKIPYASSIGRLMYAMLAIPT